MTLAKCGYLARLAMAFILCSLSAAASAAAQGGTAIGSAFHDCADCPEMVVVGPGSFIMGQYGVRRSSPPHQVTIGRGFSIGRYDVTFDEYDACVADHGCQGPTRDYGWGRGRRPVVDISWDDAVVYAAWLSHRTGRRYRLPSEAEYEYAMRAGSTDAFWFGNDIGRNAANCNGCGSAWDNRMTAPVGSFAPNAFGIYDAVGNISRWVQDQWHANYDGAPTDGSVWANGDPLRRVIRGGSWFNGPDFLHSAYRNADTSRVRNGKIGFRIARDL